MNIMAEQNDPMAEVMAMLEAEPTSSPAPGPDIPALREQLAILVSTGRCKEATGVNLTQDQVKGLENKDVMSYYKRYETFVGAKTTKTLFENFLWVFTKALGMVVPLKNVEDIHKELKIDYIITKELSGGLALRCGRVLAVANAFFITAKHAAFSGNEEPPHPSRDAIGYPLAGYDEVPTAKQSPVTSE